MSNTSTTPKAEKHDWAHAGNEAKEAAVSAGEMASHAASAVGSAASQGASDVGKKVDQLTSSAGEGLQGWGDSLSENTPHTGMLGKASQATAQSIKDGGKYLEEAKLSGMAEDMAELVRRNPVPAVLIAIGLGWFVARALRS
jgi:hypothetical protein